MKQLPGKKNEQFLRVQMDEAELHKLLDPILKEVNSLRARVAELEDAAATALKFAEVTAEVQGVVNELLTVLCTDLALRQDDGR